MLRTTFAEVDGVPGWLCWLENEDDIAWWHGDEVGFMGRRHLPDRLPDG